MKSLALNELAARFGARLRGSGSVRVTGIGPLTHAGPHELAFLASANYLKHLATSRAGAVILTQEHLRRYGGNALIVADPYLAYAQVSKLFDPRPGRAAGIHPSAVVAASAEIAPTAAIGAHCTVGEHVVIEDGVEIYPGVVISENSRVGKNSLLYANVRIGANVVIHSGAVIGADGFGFAPGSEGWVKIHQLGGVLIEDNVEIGASSTIDRGALGDTVIHAGVIIDNQVHLGHNVEVGERTAIAGCVGIAGSTKIGKDCTFGGLSGVNGHLNIADRCHFNGGTMVSKGTEQAGAYASAIPMQEVRQWRRNVVRYAQLNALAGRLKQLEKARKK